MSANARERPRVALVVHDIAGYGGMDRALTEMIQRTHESFEFVVFSATLAPSLRPLVEWRRVRMPARPMPLRFVVFFVVAGLRIARERSDLLCTVGAIIPNRVDVVSVHHCHAGFRCATGRLAPSAAPLARRINTGLTRLLSLAAERWSYRPRRVSALAAVSGGLASELRRHFPGIPVAVVPNGVDHQRFAPNDTARRTLRAELQVGSEDLVVIFVGGNWDHKGLGVAIEAVAWARDRGASSLLLWVLGQGDTEHYSLLARSLGVAEAVVFFGPRTDTERFYQASDIFVLPSQYEALSLVALEALSVGLPVVGTPVNGLRELFEGQPPGMLVERTPESVGAALTTLAADPDLRRKMSSVGRTIAREFTWDRTVDAISRVFSTTLTVGQRATDLDRHPLRDSR